MRPVSNVDRMEFQKECELLDPRTADAKEERWENA